MLAPTTLLVRQHFRVFPSASGPAGPGRPAVALRDAKDAKETKRALAEGSVDIVVGTHALLGQGRSPSRTSACVIVDEEQHFGVAHKERLKQLRAEVHVLTMTATPIPRTLHMALGGMKDLSLIATPPVDRLAVRSFVMPSDPVVLREALLREHYRGGQSFYVCPRISDQAKLRERSCRSSCPELKIGVANGQMPARDLEQVMTDFYDRKFDLLLATNIIESGLDIPTANTLIIHRADHVRPGPALPAPRPHRPRQGRAATPTSPCRPAARSPRPPSSASRSSSRSTALGAGFQLASHDLDIRGAGNLLGEEQSGQIREVGFELYNQHARGGGAAAPRKAGAGARPRAPTGRRRSRSTPPR